ncbi:hypothetical protein COHA_003074 [Chlorella ohadii]|uniref:GHMP kinase N-terminal domain-containing protein n=1 Tax=Chlorella ohadii TaxID=2649997 RepID=A0AAD5DWA2_9CHLO|nr:hypothetical protein COHA_003074 [Chlorella ohadii]
MQQRLAAQRSAAPASSSARAAAARRCRPAAAAARRPTVCSAGGSELKLFSPSKINVFLRIVRRREDGYHDLASLFHVIDLGDDMAFEELAGTASADALSCNMDGVPTDESNLVIKALNLFRRKTGRKQRFKVDLQKRVPHGAGLGGGSGNAATTLWAANELCGRPASNEELLEWSGEIGSDISVFFSRGAAYCTGRGEIVEDVAPPLPLDTPLLLVKPPVGLSTPEIFKALDLGRRSTADPLDLLARLSTEGAAQELTVNDLEQPAFDRLPALLALKERLAAEGRGYSSVFMTGSGSTIVCIGSDDVPAFLQEPQYTDLFVTPARLITRQLTATRSICHRAQTAVLCARRPAQPLRAFHRLSVRCDSDDEIVPIVSGRQKRGFTPKEYEQLRNPDLLGGATIGEELGEPSLAFH